MYYFAYSSNMNFDHMRRLCGRHFSVLGVATLKDYEFGPDLRGYFNIREKSGAQVTGVLYQIDQHCLDVLDDAEGYPEVFKRIEVQVSDMKNEMVKAWVYIQDAAQFGGKYVKPDFLRRVIVGARENRLPEIWIKALESFRKFING